MVIKFDDIESHIPSGEGVKEAILSLYVMNTYSLAFPCKNGDTKGLLRLLKDWDESEIEWEIPWSEDGGDFSLDISEFATSSNDSIEVWEQYDVTAVIRKYVKNPSSNHGFILLFSEDFIEGTRDYGVYYASSEHDVQSKRPKLTINTGTGIINKSIKKNTITGVSFYQTTSNVHFSIANENCNIKIRNLRGQILTSFQAIAKRKYSIPLHTLSNGVHFLTVSSGLKNQRIIPFIITE